MKIFLRYLALGFGWIASPFLAWAGPESDPVYRVLLGSPRPRIGLVVYDHRTDVFLGTFHVWMSMHWLISTAILLVLGAAALYGIARMVWMRSAGSARPDNPD